jgi:hypothetical protein
MRSFLMNFHQIVSNDQTEKNNMGGACGTYEGGRDAYTVSVGKPDGKRALGT